VTTDSTPGTQDNCIETYDIETTENTDTSDSENNTNFHHYDKNMFQLGATTREIIRDWCGGDTSLTQESFGSSGEVMEQDKTTDKDSNNDLNEPRSWNNNTDKFDDDDDDNGVMNGDLYHNGHNGNNDKSDSSNESDNDSDDDRIKSDDSNESDNSDDNDIESDDVNDEDCVYDSEDEADSKSDEDYNRKSNKFKHTLHPRNVKKKVPKEKKVITKVKTKVKIYEQEEEPYKNTR